MPDTETQDVQIAIAGAGFAGLGMAIALRRTGSTTSSCSSGPTTSAAPGATTPIRAAPATSRRTCTPSRSRRTPLEPHVLPAARDPGLHAGCADRYGLRAAPALRRTRSRGRAGTTDAERWQIETSGGTLTAEVLVSAAGAAGRSVDPRPARPRDVRGHGLPLRALGPRPRPDRPRASRSSAPAPRRSSSCPRSSPRRAAAPVPAHAAVGPAARRRADPRGWRTRLSPRIPAAAARLRARHVLGARAVRARLRCTRG